MAITSTPVILRWLFCLPVLASKAKSDDNSAACSCPHVSPTVPCFPSRRKLVQTADMGNSGSCIPEAPKVERTMPVSPRANDSAVSFLDLPPEIRNNIYCRVLIFEGYVRPESNIPATRLFQTCKQIHEEASSIFYAANSFYFYCQRVIFFDSSDRISPRNFSENYPQGLIWPAARYHIHLTRVVFDTHVTLTNRTNEPAVEEQLRKRFHKSHTFMQSLWAPKMRKWSDRIICDRKFPKARLDCMIAFSEDDEDVTKIFLRKC
ncbi:hypothetical protein V2W45_1468641 [Cenococcum geophilum]